LLLTITEVIANNGTRFQCLEIDLAVPKLDPAFLSKLELPAGLNLSKGVVLWGAAPIWLYSHLVKRCMALGAAWVGTFDLRTGSFVVVASRCSEMIPGEAFGLINKSQSSAILIGGLPNSGKSFLCYALDYNLKRRTSSKNIQLHRAQWDGEGSWFAEMENRPLAEELSKHFRTQGSNRFFLNHAEAVSNILQSMELVFVDFGGKPEPPDLVLVRRCTHYIIISREQEVIAFWHDFCGRRGGLKPLAVIHSVQEKRE
jgi:CRISPR-associated protein Csx3